MHILPVKLARKLEWGLEMDKLVKVAWMVLWYSRFAVVKSAKASITAFRIADGNRWTMIMVISELIASLWFFKQEVKCIIEKNI